MTIADEADKKARLELARDAGPFRHSLIQELLEPGLSQAETARSGNWSAVSTRTGPTAGHCVALGVGREETARRTN
jgi:hypothetical protein